MIYFAELGLDNIVRRVIPLKDDLATDEYGVVQESLGRSYCRSNFGGTWIQTFKDGTRKNFAGIGYTYDSTRDAFIPPQVYSSWTLNEETCLWECPMDVPEGTETSKWDWDESSQNWINLNA